MNGIVARGGGGIAKEFWGVQVSGLGLGGLEAVVDLHGRRLCRGWIRDGGEHR